MLNVDAVLVVRHGKKSDNYKKTIGIQSSLFQQVNAPMKSFSLQHLFHGSSIYNISLFNMFLLPNKYTQLTPSPLTPVKGFATRKGGHGSFGFGKHLPNDRRFGLVICRENPLRISRKLASYDVQKQPILAWQVNKNKIWFIQTITQLSRLEIHRTSWEILTLDFWHFCWGYGRWAGKGSVQRSWHERKKPCTNDQRGIVDPWRSLSRPIRFSDIRWSSSRNVLRVLFFATREASMINGRRWAPMVCPRIFL